MVVLWKWTPGGDPLATGHNVVLKVTSEANANGDPDYTTIEDERTVMPVSHAPPPPPPRCAPPDMR